MDNILFITSGSIGDAIISTGILGYLMDEYPEAEFTVATGPAAIPLFQGCPRIVKVVSMFKLPWNKHWFLLWKETKDITWDLTVDLRGSVIGYILNAHKRIIFQRPKKSLSKAEQLASMMNLESPPPTRLWITDEVRAKAKAMLPAGKIPVVLAPRTNSPLKDWSVDRFAELARRIYKDNVIFVVMATGLQHQSLQPLFRTLPADRVLDLCGKTDLPTAYGIIEQAKLFIGNDSGLLHMAAAAKTPAVGIYGPSNDKTYAPRAGNIRIVTAINFMPGEEERRDPAIIKLIDVEKVEAAVKELAAI